MRRATAKLARGPPRLSRLGPRRAAFYRCNQRRHICREAAAQGLSWQDVSGLRLVCSLNSQVHKPISARLILTLGLVVYCLPANPLAILPGAPLGIVGGLVLMAIIAGAVAIDRPVRHGALWLAALAAIAIVRWSSGALSPSLGWSAAYIAGDEPGRAIERSSEFLSNSVTRVDRALDFEAASFPVHFFNDIRRFNYYRPTDTARDTMPFHVTWRGSVAERPAGATSLVLVTNGPVEIRLGDQAPVSFLPTDAGREYPLPADSFSTGTAVSISYTRRFEVNPTLRLQWVNPGGSRWPVGAPEIVASQSDIARAWLARPTQWLGSLSSLALLAVLATALLAARGANGPTPIPFHAAERAFVALLVIWAAADSIAGWLSFERDAILLSGGNDWLAYESFARDIQLNGLLMNNGRPPGSGEAFYYQPAYAYALALLHGILGESLGSVLWWQHASLGLVAALVYGLTRQLWGPLAAVIASLLVMAFRSLELSAVSDLLLSENLLFLVLPVMLWLFVRATQHPTARTLALAGAALGLAGLTRSTPLLVLPFALLGMSLASRRDGGWRRVVPAVGIFTIACFAVVGLATARNAIVSGRPVLITTSAGANLIEAHRPTENVDLSGIDQNPLYDRLGFDRQTREVAEFIRQDPRGYLATLWPTAAYAIGYAEPMLPGRGIEWPLLGVFLVYLAATLLVPATRRNGAWLVHAFILTHLIQTALFFSHQYGFRLPLPMYLPMLAVIGGASATLLRAASRRASQITLAHLPRPFVWAGVGLLTAFAFASVALRWPAATDSAATRLYALEGDAAHVATAVHDLPDTQRPAWAYGAGNDTRTREIAYLRGLAFPLIKWVDTDRGMVFPETGRAAILGAPSDRQISRFSACLHPKPRTAEVTLYGVDSPADTGCLDLRGTSGSEFEHFGRVSGASFPSGVRAGEKLAGQVAWQVIARPPGRYRPLLELVGMDDRVAASAESNPYGSDLWSPGEIISSVHELAVEAKVPPGQYTLALSFVGSNPRPNLVDPGALLYRASLGTVTVEPPSQPLQPSQLGIPLRDAWSAGGLSLVGAGAAQSSLRPGDPLDVSLGWQAVDASPASPRLALEISGPSPVALVPRLTPLEGRWPLERWRRGETVAEQRTVIIPNDITPGSYRLLLRDTDRLEATVDVAAIVVEPRERRMQPSQVRATSDAVLGSRYRLAGYDLRNRRPDPGETIELGLTWQAVSTPSTRHLVVISLIDADTNRVLARRETEPSDGVRPTTGWSNGEYVVDNHRVRTSRDLPRGRYRVRVDIVERDSGRYLLDAGGMAGIVLPPEIVVD